MNIRRFFSVQAAHIHTHTYHDQPSEAYLAREQEKFVDLAEEMGITTRIVRAGDSIQFEFENFHDSAIFRIKAFGNDINPQNHLHTENFKPGDESYQQAWLDGAKNALDEMGVPYRIEHDGTDATFKFDTMAEHAIFVELRDRGVFHEMAMDGMNGPGMKLLPS